MTEGTEKQSVPTSKTKHILSNPGGSRRTFVVGLTGIAIIEAWGGGGITWHALLQAILPRPFPAPSSTSTPLPTPTPTPIPLETLLSTLHAHHGFENP